MEKKNYKPRLIDNLVEEYLKTFGALCIEGPKWCGKTWTSSFHCSSEIMIGNPEGNFQNRQLAEMSPSLVLEGDMPRLIDEWQEVPQLWDAVRYKVDQTGQKGQFILTGSATPNHKGILHSGAGRIAKLRMRPMSLYECGGSSGVVSLQDVCKGEIEPQILGEVDLRKLIDFIIRGGWPANQETDLKQAAYLPIQYINAVLDDDVYRIDNIKRDRHKMELLLRALARNEATTVTNKRLKNDMKEIDDEDIDIQTVANYLDIFNRLFLTDNQKPYDTKLRSSVRVKQAEKRHLSDPSLAAALLRATPEMLLGDLNTLRFLFEALCERDLKIYAETFGAELYHYQDYNNNEMDAVISLPDGSWCGFEIKLGANQIEAAAENLLKIKEEIKKDGGKEPASLCVICGLSNAAYKRPDGVLVVPITALKKLEGVWGLVMNLIKFINEVDEIVKKYDKEKLLQIIHEVARTLPESSRNDFIQMIKNVEKSGKVSSRQKNQSLFKQQYEHWSGILHALEEGEKCLLEEYNEEYDDWYNSSVDEILYEDPDGIGEDLDEICKFIHKCTDAEEYQYGMEIGRQFFALAIQTNGEYGGAEVELHEMKHNGFLHADLRQVAMDTMYASYMYEKPDEVPDALYEIFSNAKITADIKDLKLQNLMQYADADLKDFDVFLKDWINYLGAIPGRLAEQLYTEALELTNDIDTKIENAQKFVHTHPGLYKKLLEDLELTPKKAMEIGADGVKRISDKLIIRSEVALKTSEYAITVNADRSLIEKYYVEAFRSDTNAVNYLRAFLNSANQDICRQELKEIYSAYIRRGGRYSGYYDYGSMRVNELAENEPGKNMVYVLRLLGGEFMEVLRLGVSEKNALGWSATFMKQGLAFFLFYLSDGKNLGKGISEMAKITRYVFGFDIAAYSKGQKKNAAKDEMSFFTDIFMKWKKETEIGESDREKILRHIEKQMEKRVAGIMDANRRKYYGECASYIAAIGEIREYLGERGGKQMFMSRYAAEYPRRSAFRTELQNYGWVKRRK